MASDRASVQILVAIIGVVGVIGAAWLSKTSWQTVEPPDPMKEILRHFAIKFSTDRQGSDYKNLDLPEDRYELCAKACDDDPQCRAFVYTPRGHEGPNARCWLKADTPPERPVPGFVSGVKLP